MMEIFKTLDNEQGLSKIDKIEKGCWINLVAPTEEELNYVKTI
jgi:magnesium transporter